MNPTDQASKYYSKYLTLKNFKQGAKIIKKL